MVFVRICPAFALVNSAVSDLYTEKKV